MSESSDKGRQLEEQVAKVLNKKLGVRVQRDKKSGAGSHQKMDITDWFEETPLAVECKSQQAIKIKEWFRQAVKGASFRQMPTVVFTADDEVLAALRFSDLADLLADIKQARGEITDLRRPIEPALNETVAQKVEKGAKTCPNGHLIAAGGTKCLTKGCKYSSGYRPKKEKK